MVAYLRPRNSSWLSLWLAAPCAMLLHGTLGLLLGPLQCSWAENAPNPISGTPSLWADTWHFSSETGPRWEVSPSPKLVGKDHSGQLQTLSSTFILQKENEAENDSPYLEWKLMGREVSMTISEHFPFFQASRVGRGGAGICVHLSSLSFFPWNLHQPRTKDRSFSETRLLLFAFYLSCLEKSSPILYKVSKLLLPRFITFIG